MLLVSLVSTAVRLRSSMYTRRPSGVSSVIMGAGRWPKSSSRADTWYFRPR